MDGGCFRMRLCGESGGGYQRNVYENESDGADEFNENPLAKNRDKRLEKQSSDDLHKNLRFKLNASSGKDVVVSDDESDSEDEISVTREKLMGEYKSKIDLGFVHTVTSNGISVSLNGIFYFSAIYVNGVFEIDMNDNVSKYNNNSIFSINKKRKLDLNSSYLWHCRLAHIGKTRMQKLQREGLLESINDDSYDKCESCISGKM
ncbi:retrotransposon protein, putative, ty1-copia subclass [Tanacetum coccineum]